MNSKPVDTVKPHAPHLQLFGLSAYQIILINRPLPTIPTSSTTTSKSRSTQSYSRNEVKTGLKIYDRSIHRIASSGALMSSTVPHAYRRGKSSFCSNPPI